MRRFCFQKLQSAIRAAVIDEGGARGFVVVPRKGWLIASFSP